MIEAQFNMFDAAVILILLLSVLLAFFRGFVREFLSLGAWVGAGLVTLYSYEQVADMLRPHTSSDMVAYLLAGVGTYIVVLLTLSILSAMIVRYVKTGSEVGMLDNFLGFIFGILRGAFIVSLGYLVLSLMIDNDNPPTWVEEAATRPLVQRGALWLASVSPEYLEDISSLSESLEKQVQEAENPLDADTIELLRDDDVKLLIDKNKGYSEEEREFLENLMKSTPKD